MSGRARLHHAINETAKKQANRQQTVTRGTVTRVDPLEVEAFGYAHTLTEANDLDLSGFMQIYDAFVGLKKHDMVLLIREDQWVLFDVVPGRTDVVAKFKAQVTA